MKQACLLVSSLILSACGGSDVDVDPCRDVACSGHGSCAVVDDAPRCQCEPGYEASGLTCRAVTGDPCDPDPCVYGACSDVDGEARCTCDPGYAGERCNQCAPGYVPDGLVCVPAEGTPCDPNPCDQEHRGVCEVVGDTFACRCDPGYHDEGGACVPDAGDPCDPNPCTDPHRTVCEPGGGTFACRCDSGYQDNDANGTCTETCATANLPCDADEICDDRSGTATCVTAVKPPLYISFHWHMHQPIYWPYESVVDTEASGAMGYSLYAIHFDRTGPYTGWPRDAIASGLDHAHLGAQVSMSGSLMENLNHLEATGVGFSGWKAPWAEAMGWTTEGGNPRLDLVSFGYHHPLMGLIDDLDIRLQIQTHREAVSRNFGPGRSRGIFPPECAFSERMIPALEAEGIEWVLIDNVHFDRAHRDYPFRPESNLPPPNPADQVNTQATSWIQLNGLWAPSEVSAPWGYQPHFVEHTDPETGETTRIVAVPAARYEGNEDARGGFGALQYEAVMSQYEHLNTDPLHPMLIVLHHDGDNYGGGTESYYHGNFQGFVDWLRDRPDRFVATTIQDYLDRFPPDPADVIHVEPGSWSGADNGDPEFHKWNGDPGADGYSPDRNSWAVITAVKNRVLTAERIQPHTSAAAIVDGTGSDTDRAWHWLLNAQTSCYWYWDNSMDGIWDSHPTRAANPAAQHADTVIAGGLDEVGPTIYLPQREPYNPGHADLPADFTVWTYVYDVSGLERVTLHLRVDADGVRDGANERYAGGTWSEIPMTGEFLPSRTDPLPLYKAERYTAGAAPARGDLIDYYVSAADTLGQVTRSPLIHVFVME